MKIFTSKDGLYELHWNVNGSNDPQHKADGIKLNNTGNCGISCISGGGMVWKKVVPATARPSNDPWNSAYPISGLQWQPYSKYPGADKDNPYQVPKDLPALSEQEIWELFLKSVSEWAEKQEISMYIMSNGVSSHEQSYLEGGIAPDDPNHKAAYKLYGYRVCESRFNLWLWRALRELKCGTLITSPIVENLMHKGEGSIMAAIWIPPKACRARILHGKVGVSIGHTEEDVASAKKLLPKMVNGVASFVEHFYGRKTVGARIAGQNSHNTGGVACAVATA